MLPWSNWESRPRFASNVKEYRYGNEEEERHEELIEVERLLSL
jgi:hypothetical protein